MCEKKDTEDFEVTVGLEECITVPEISLTINGNIENICITINHFTSEEDKGEE